MIGHEAAQHLILRLNPKTQSINIHVDGLRVALSPSDIAASLKGLPAIAVQIAEASILGSQEAVEHIRFWLLAVVINLSYEQHWKTDFDKKRQFTDIIHRDIFSARCPTCKGRKEAPDPETHKIINCQACNGLGRIPRTIVEKSKQMGISTVAYFKTWKAREWTVKARYEEHENEAIEALRKNLGH